MEQFIKYFGQKLRLVVNSLESNEKHLLNACHELKIKDIQSYTDRISNLSDECDKIIKEIVEWVPVSFAIPILKEHGDKIDKYRIEYAYKYNDKGISYQERELLVQEFGYGMKEAKVK